MPRTDSNHQLSGLPLSHIMPLLSTLDALTLFSNLSHAFLWLLSNLIKHCLSIPFFVSNFAKILVAVFSSLHLFMSLFSTIFSSLGFLISSSAHRFTTSQFSILVLNGELPIRDQKLGMNNEQLRVSN
jgi:hypothetical protein